MEFIRHGADPFKALVIGSHNHLKSLYDYIIGLDKAKLYTKEAWREFKYYSNRNRSKDQFNELYFNLIEECEKSGHSLNPQETRYVFTREKPSRTNFTNHNLILHLWFALPHQIKVRAQNKAHIATYLNSGFSPIEGNVICTGFYLVFVIFHVCSEELALTKEQRSVLRRIVTHTYRQFKVS
jgi:hypothetical protein